MKKAILLAAAMGIATFSQAQFAFPKEIYLNPKTATISKTHKTIAILPVSVKFIYKTQQFDFDPEAERIAEMNTSTILQSSLYSYLLPKSIKMALEIQDPETTDVLLRRAEISNSAIALTKVELAKILGVDAVVSALYEAERPVPVIQRHQFPAKPPVTAPGAETLAITPVYYITALTLNLNDAPSGTLLWRYYRKVAGSNSYEITDELISKMLKDFPYSK